MTYDNLLKCPVSEKYIQRMNNGDKITQVNSKYIPPIQTVDFVVEHLETGC